MMKFKTWMIALALGAVTTPAMAQFEDTDVNDRAEYSFKKAGVPAGEVMEDSIKIARGYVSMFQQSIQNQDYKDAYVNWKWLMKNTPFINNGIYAGNAPYMFYQLITNEQDANQKLVYFNDMMRMFDDRLARLDSINSYNKVKNTKGDVLAVRADYYNYTAPVMAQAKIDCGYTLQKHYGNYADAIKEIKENGGREIEGSVLQNFILISDAYFKNIPSHREQYLQDYLDAKDACEKMLQMAKEAEAEGDTAKAQQLLAKYDAPLAQIETTFATSGAAEREQVIALYEKTIEDKKDNLAYLRSAMTLMSNADCDDADIYYKAAQYAYAIEPTFESAIGLGQFEQKNNNLTKMLEYYNKAIELCQTDATRGNICLRIASALRKSSQYTGALNYLDKARNYNNDIAGKAYIQQATVYSQLGQYNEAIASARKATAADITVSGTADRLIASIQKAQANAAANAKAKAEYDKYMAKKKAEEDFWKGK
ncbi:MAG: tetratricopeptide repeat protein [Bacteroidaceae bacterium]|nr:tetratricopeptide repeat protein [Bacteroidaceae bacterium]